MLDVGSTDRDESLHDDGGATDVSKRASQHRAEDAASISSWGTAKHLYRNMGSVTYFILVFYQQKFHFYILLSQFFVFLNYLHNTVLSSQKYALSLIISATLNVIII